MEDKKFRETLLKKLDLNNRLLALQLVKDKSTLVEKIEELSVLGIGPSDIAFILGTSANYVSVTLNRIKKKAKKEKGNDNLPSIENKSLEQKSNENSGTTED